MDEESDDSEEEEVKPATKKPAAQPSKTQAKAKIQQEESSEEEEDEDVPVKSKANTTSSKQPAQTKKVQEESEEEDEEEEKTPPMKSKPAPKKNAIEEENGATAAANDSREHEAYVGNLPFDATEHDIREYFSECGTVTSVNLLMGNGRSKGIAFVRFADAESLQNAVNCNGELFNGRALKIEKSTPKESRAPRETGNTPRGEKDPNSTTVFVGNLSYNTTEDAVRSLFETCGKVKDVRIAYDAEGKV